MGFLVNSSKAILDYHQCVPNSRIIGSSLRSSFESSNIPGGSRSNSAAGIKKVLYFSENFLPAHRNPFFNVFAEGQIVNDRFPIPSIYPSFSMLPISCLPIVFFDSHRFLKI